MPIRQLVPVYSSAVRGRLLKLLSDRYHDHRVAAEDRTRKVGERVAAEAKSRECLALRQMVAAMRDD